MSGNTVIYHHNIFDGATVASTNNYAYNLFDGVVSITDAITLAATTEYVQMDYGSSVACDYVAVTRFTDATGGDITLKVYCDTALVTTQTIGSSNQVYVFEFDSTSGQVWKVEWSDQSGGEIIGNLYLGQKTDFGAKNIDGGYTPPPYSPEDEIVNNITDGGFFISRYVRVGGYSFTIPLRLMPEDEAAWQAFMDKAEVDPFFVKTYNYTACAWLTEDPQYQYQQFLWRQADLTCEGIV